MTTEKFHQALRALADQDQEGLDEVMRAVREAGRDSARDRSGGALTGLLRTQEWSTVTNHMLTEAAAFGDLPFTAATATLHGKLRAVIVFTEPDSVITVAGHTIEPGMEGDHLGTIVTKQTGDQ
jgi:hypothetical protein